jgi:hypothetical protein
VLPITEATPTVPINPYGKAKLAAEGVVRDFAAANPVGARSKFKTPAQIETQIESLLKSVLNCIAGLQRRRAALLQRVRVGSGGAAGRVPAARAALTGDTLHSGGRITTENGT